MNLGKNICLQILFLIGIFRDPLKVAESLKKRNGFEYEKSLNLWTIYNKQLLGLLEKYNGFLINFDEPKQKIFSEIELITEKLGLVNPINLSDWYTEQLLHSDKSFKKDFVLNDEIKEVYSNLITKSKNNNKVEFENIKKINKENLYIISSLFSQLYNQSKFFRVKLDEIKNESNEKNNLLSQLEKEFDERTKWAQNLESDVKNRDEIISKLEKEFDERTKWAQNLESDVKNRDEIISKLEKEFDERTKWAQNLESDVKNGMKS